MKIFNVTGGYNPVASSTLKYVNLTISSICSEFTVSSDPYISSGYGYSSYDYRHHMTWTYTSSSPIIHIERSSYSSGYYNMMDTIIPGFGYLRTSGHSVYSVLVRSGTKYLTNGGFSYTLGDTRADMIKFTLSSDFKTFTIAAHYCSDSSTNMYSSCTGLGQDGEPTSGSYGENILILY